MPFWVDPGSRKLVGAIGLEPTTPTMSRWCSNQLSYAPAKSNSLAWISGVVQVLARAPRVLRMLGRHSLAVYMVHQPVLIGLAWLIATALGRR